MSCLRTIGTETEGSDIGLTVRYKDGSGAYPDISDVTAEVKAINDSTTIFDISIGSPSANGSSVTLETDATSQYIAIHIDGLDTEGISGDLDIYTKIDSANTGLRTEAKGTYKICQSEI